MTDIHRTEVDGVTTIWVDAPAPLRAGLLFRTGRADETLNIGGQTHLIEHLSLSSMSDNRQNNGLVGGIITGFFTMGKPQDVSDFFSKVCDSLSFLPRERLENEKHVLAAESAGRRYDLRSNLLTWRFGTKGYGQLSLPELGLQKATIEQLRDYAAERFTRENAILWLSGPLPEDHHLRLPKGAKLAIPSFQTILQQALPGWFLDENSGGISVGSIVPRSYAATVFCQIAAARLRKLLRMDHAVSYQPTVFYDPLDAETAHLIFYADSDVAHRVELANLFGEVINGFSQIDEAEIETAKDQILEHQIGSLAPPPVDLKVIEVQRAAMDWIMGTEFKSLEESTPHTRSVTAEEVRTFAKNLQSSAIYALPAKIPVLPCFGEKILLSKGPVVKGRQAINLDAPIRPEKLVYGSEGVSMLWPKNNHSTVRYSDLAAVLRYADGGIQLIGNNTATVVVEPTIWRDGPNICRQICEPVSAELLIDQPARPTDKIPRHNTTAWQRFKAQISMQISIMKANPYKRQRVIRIFFALLLSISVIYMMIYCIFSTMTIGK